MESIFSAHVRDLFFGFEEQKKAFIKQFQAHGLHRKEMVFFEGEADDSCYYIASGIVRVFRTTESGKEVGLHVRFPGSFISLSEVLENRSRKDVGAQALTDGEVYVLNNDAFKKILHCSMKLFKRVVACNNRDLHVLEERYVSLATEEVRERLLRLLALLHQDASSADPDAAPLSLPLSQTHIAGMIKSTQCTVSRTLRQLEKEGVLALSRECVQIIAPSALPGRITGPYGA